MNTASKRLSKSNSAPQRRARRVPRALTAAGKIRIEREIRRTLRDVARIQSLTHPVSDKDLRINLLNARTQRKDAVRALIIQLATAMENMLDELYRRVFLGYRPAGRNPKRPRGKLAKELDELLEGGGRVNKEREAIPWPC